MIGRNFVKAGDLMSHAECVKIFSLGPDARKRLSQQASLRDDSPCKFAAQGSDYMSQALPTNSRCN